MQLQRWRSHKTLRRRRKPFHINCGERWKSEYKGIRPALGGMIGSLLAAHVADVGAAVVGRVGVHDFTIETGLRNAETIAFADDRRGVDDGNDEVFRVFAVDDFVVGKGKQEIFRESIKERKSEFVVLVLAMDRVMGKIL